MNFNKVILVGRITHDPELKITQGGTEVVNFQLAVNRQRKDDPADFFRVVCFNKTAEFLNNYVTKGKLLLVEGSLRNNSWQDNSGQKKTSTEIVAMRIVLMERLGENSSYSEAGNTDDYQPNNAGNAGNNNNFGGSDNQNIDEYGDDDIPF